MVVFSSLEPKAELLTLEDLEYVATGGLTPPNLWREDTFEGMRSHPLAPSFADWAVASATTARHTTRQPPIK